MVTLSFTDVLPLVRKNLDEQDPNGSFMYPADENGSSEAYGDNRSLDAVIGRDLPESINAVHKAAPVMLLEGEELEASDIAVTIGSTPLPVAAVGTDGVLSFTMDADTKYMRLVSFKAADSPVVVTDAIPEASPEGHKQLNPHIRGRKDRPRLVQLQGMHTGPSFRYYALDPDGSDFATYRAAPLTAFEMRFLREQFYQAPTAVGSTEIYPAYPISRRLRQNIIDWLTAMVMETYGMQAAQAYYQKALTFPSL